MQFKFPSSSWWRGRSRTGLHGYVTSAAFSRDGYPSSRGSRSSNVVSKGIISYLYSLHDNSILIFRLWPDDYGADMLCVCFYMSLESEKQESLFHVRASVVVKKNSLRFGCVRGKARKRGHVQMPNDDVSINIIFSRGICLCCVPSLPPPWTIRVYKQYRKKINTYFIQHSTECSHIGRFISTNRIVNTK
jgi:hypothetical protein